METILSAVGCAKMAEPIDIPFALWARMGSRYRVLDGVLYDIQILF